MRLSGRFLLAGATALTLASLASAQCPGTNDCCLPSPDATVGCNDQECCDQICAADPFCCNTQWDQICANAAVLNCAVCQIKSTCPPSANDCCLPSPDGTPGCADTACCDLICSQDAFCCDTQWDSLCSDAALAQCDCSSGSCPPSANDCCVPSPDGTPGCADTACCDLICAQDPFCCDTTWDSLCSGAAQTQCDCELPECPPSANDCCAPSPDGTPGCADTNCCSLVCAQDPFCCDTAWDALCSNAAISLCGCVVACPENPDSCFSAHALPGCNDPACCELVCAVDPFCCQTAWDGICVSEAFSFCEAPECNLPPCDGNPELEKCGADTNGGCNTPPQGSSNCCIANGGAGCDDPTCEATVCSIDPFCCDTAWDAICADEAATFCPDICVQAFNFEEIECNKTICGTAWASGGTRDTDWYQITLTDTPGTLVSFSIENQLPMVIGIVDTNGIPDCSLATALNPFAVSPFCGTASFEACLPPGTYWFFAAPDGFDGFPCGNGLNDYTLRLDCLGICEPPACGESAKHDCLTVGGPFCNDAECCEMVCAVDPFCCDTAWDQLCVNQANVMCYGGSICPPSDHDCFTQGGPGCTDTECCETVCAVDPFCCQTAWDGICVDEALTLCGTPKCPLECLETDTPEGEDCGADTNGGCNSNPPIFGAIACGETICGNAWASGGTRDTDWYQITFGSDTEVIITIEGQMPMIAGPVNTGGIPDCGLASAIDPFVITGFCGTGEVSTTLVAGTWWIFAAPATFDGFPCDSGTNTYRLSLQCPTDCISRGADFNGDDCVDGDDLGTLLGEWGTGGGYGIADFNCDGIVDGDDLGTLLGEWGGAGCV